MDMSSNLSISSLGESDMGRFSADEDSDIEFYDGLSDEGRFVLKVVQTLLSSVVDSDMDNGQKVVLFREPRQLEEALSVDPQSEGESDERLLKRIGQVIKYSVRVNHPLFVNQLYSGLDSYGFAGSIVSSALNASLYTFEVAPVFTIIELAVLREMRRIVGFMSGDGIFAPGGSISNLYAYSCARFQACPDVKTKGLAGLPRLVAFASEDAHYSVDKAGSLIGIGSDNVVRILTNDNGEMLVSDLERKIQETIKQGAKPFIVVATCGTTVMGAFDPVKDIAPICEKYKIWLHVDAAWGGGALISRKHRALLTGIEKADSVTWNPHKLLGCPQQASAFLTRHEQILTEAHSTFASYLFQPDKYYNAAYDAGEKSFQCGRPADSFKFWLMWKAKGTDGLEQHVDQLFERSRYFADQISKLPNFRMVLPQVQCTNVCFWYVPTELQSLDPKSDAYTNALHKVAPHLKGMMVRDGHCMLSYQPQWHKGRPNFFRLVLQNSDVTEQHLDSIIEILEKLGSSQQWCQLFGKSCKLLTDRSANEAVSI